MRKVSRLSRFNIASLALGLAFLYLPILILVIYSFNASRLVTVWGGWSLRWYHEFFNDRAMIEAAWMSLRVAVSSAGRSLFEGPLGDLRKPGRLGLALAARRSGRLVFRAWVPRGLPTRDFQGRFARLSLELQPQRRVRR